jgi:transmembrane sensor
MAAPAPDAEPASPPDSNVVPLRTSRRLWLGGALAASLVALVSFGVMQRAPGDYRIETAMGEARTLTLADGSRIAVNGGSSILLSNADPRRATLERGQALFTVVHREDAPFRVSVGKAQLVDVGTVFDVTRSGAQTVLSVSEGAVVYNPAADNVRVDAGHRLAVRDEGKAALSAISAASVGGWSSGQLIYDGVPLGDVVAEVARTTGVQIRTTPAATSILFRGALQMDQDKTQAGEARLVGDLAGLSGTRATQDAGGWMLSR